LAVRDYHFGLAYWNSIKIAVINLTGSVLTSTLAGYAFAKIKFRGRNILFLIYLATM
ncbi:MAG TPA: sugar ABC transporter ATP-binding protein, partial [Clostridium sp.]|nr:sugar ABC transporter ATP-binding protein [Clostridium sp.]